jgi:hypothetical protein
MYPERESSKCKTDYSGTCSQTKEGSRIQEIGSRSKENGRESGQIDNGGEGLELCLASERFNSYWLVTILIT